MTGGEKFKMGYKIATDSLSIATEPEPNRRDSGDAKHNLDCPNDSLGHGFP